MGYTTCRGTDLLAFGASSISGIGSTYSQDVKGLPEYTRAIAEGRLPVERGYLLTPDDELRRELIIDLFCNFAVDLDALRDRFGEAARQSLAPDLERLAPLAADGLVEVTDAAVTVTPTGRFFVRNVCMTFDRHLGTNDGPAVYSRTV
jgi:oxygen-independent coproporphyrinogen-3 oxidase